MAEAAEKALSDGPAFRLPWISSSLALLEYRRGNDLKATTLCTRCLSSPDCDAPRAALAHVIQALAYWRLGQYAEGFTELSRAQERIDPAFKNGLSLNPNNDPAHNWFDWVLARILMRECQEQLLESDRSLAQMTVPASSVESAAKYRVLGEWHALRQEWRDAAERLGVLVEVDRVDGWETITLDYFKLSLALIEAGKRDDFNRFREEFVARYGHTTNATAANRVIKSSLLLPAPRQLLELLEPYARACEEVDYEQLRLCRGLELVIAGIAGVSARELRQGKRPVPQMPGLSRKECAMDHHSATDSGDVLLADASVPGSRAQNDRGPGANRQRVRERA